MCSKAVANFLLIVFYEITTEIKIAWQLERKISDSFISPIDKVGKKIDKLLGMQVLLQI